jgi:hypothetical protein
MADSPAQRLVPGAPPPIEKTKSQRKKRKPAGAKGGTTDSAAGTPVATNTALPDATSAALTEHAPAPAEIKEGALAPELVAEPDPAPLTPAVDHKRSGVYELVNKRQKTLGKKIVRES